MGFAFLLLLAAMGLGSNGSAAPGALPPPPPPPPTPPDPRADQVARQRQGPDPLGEIERTPVRGGGAMPVDPFERIANNAEAAARDARRQVDQAVARAERVQPPPWADRVQPPGARSPRSPARPAQTRAPGRSPARPARAPRYPWDEVVRPGAREVPPQPQQPQAPPYNAPAPAALPTRPTPPITPLQMRAATAALGLASDLRASGRGRYPSPAQLQPLQTAAGYVGPGRNGGEWTFGWGEWVKWIVTDTARSEPPLIRAARLLLYFEIEHDATTRGQTARSGNIRALQSVIGVRQTGVVDRATTAQARSILLRNA